jgi:hypothetical protein
MEIRKVPARKMFVRTAALVGLAAIGALTVQARTEGRFLRSDHISVSPIYWLSEEVGTSMLVRTPSGISFTYQTSGLPAGQVVTLWVVVFNNPDACATDPCTFADMPNPEAQGDFLYGGGHVIGGSGRGNYGGHLAVGDISGSGLAEIGGTALGLIDPFTAEIIFALHSHGPAVPGQTLKAQLSSFLGGCEVFLGNDGIADGPEDIPDDVGECVTFQLSVHQP